MEGVCSKISVCYSVLWNRSGSDFQQSTIVLQITSLMVTDITQYNMRIHFTKFYENNKTEGCGAMEHNNIYW